MLLKPLSLVFIVQLISFCANAQALHVELRLKGCTQKSFWVTFDDDQHFRADTLNRDSKGSFVLSSNKIFKPQIVRIISDEVSVNNIFIAPGYDLIIEGDAADAAKGFNGIIPSRYLKFYGIGSGANNYSLRLDSIADKRKLVMDRSINDRGKNIQLIEALAALKDSLANDIFSSATDHDPALNAFARIKKTDIKYEKLAQLAVLGRGTGSEATRRSLLYDNGHFSEKEIEDASLLESPSFRDFITNDYLRYLDLLSPTTYEPNVSSWNFVLLRLAAANYTGRVRQYAIKSLVRKGILILATEKDLVTAEDTLRRWINQLDLAADRNLLLSSINKLKEQFGNFADGKKMPLLRGTDIKGKEHTIKEFSNQVVYIDLWATWCGPCVAENPFLAKLEKIYKDSGLVILSISVRNLVTDWKAYIKKEKPSWPQWFDSAGKTGNMFSSALLLPRFMLINKKGIIISSNAPWPSDTEELKKMLSAALKE